MGWIHKNIKEKFPDKICLRLGLLNDSLKGRFEESHDKHDHWLIRGTLTLKVLVVRILCPEFKLKSVKSDNITTTCSY
jgi:hypothetical protein